MVKIQNEIVSTDMPHKRVFAIVENLKDEDHNLMGLSVLNNIEISKFYVLLVEF